MKIKSKALILSLCAALLVAVTIIGTVAYLTDKDSVVNTFTVGQVEIRLDEAKVNPDGSIVDENGDGIADERNKGNEYHLIPGQTYVKDPTLTVVKGSVESYVRLLVTINEQADLDAIFAPDGADLTEIFNGYDAAKWTYIGETDKEDTITYEFRYNTTVKPTTGEDLVLEPVFTSFTLPGVISNEQLKAIEGLEISVVGHAIQKAGFTDAAEAWTAFAEQVGE